MKKIILILTVILTVLTFTSFSAKKAEVYHPQFCYSEPIKALDRVEYIPNSEKKIDIPYINQRENYPNGCEVVSAVMALNYLGTDISVDDFIDLNLDMGETPSPLRGTGPHPDRVYCGDPRSDDGWGCNATVITKALNKLLDRNEYIVRLSYGDKLEDLCYDYVDRDIPVLVWVTVDMEDASSEEYYRYWITEDGKEISYNSRLHCMLLCGYDSDNYYFNDPLTEKLKAYPKAKSEKAYAILGMQSVVVMQKTVD